MIDESIKTIIQENDNKSIAKRNRLNPKMGPKLRSQCGVIYTLI